ncbi:MAG TPA: urease accessory protein UreF [Acidocella sp.]|jgi:urease accessory protein|nr:urease accessory protein UreF [Acidocella sp.]
MAERSLLRLLTWLSPAFPTGGFAYSHGLEWAVEAGLVRDEASLTGWMEDTLRLGALWSDAILVRLAHRGEDVSAQGMTLCPTAERRLESSAQGAAFALAAAAWPGVEWDDTPLPYAVAVGKLAAAHGVAEDDTALAFLHAASANLVSAAIRLIPLGQMAGLRVQAALEPTILDVARASKSIGRDDLGGACWLADIAAMRHETQYTRLFRS